MNNKFFAVSVDALLKTFSVVDAGEAVSFHIEPDDGPSISANDYIIGFVGQGIDQFRMAFVVTDVEGDSLSLSKIIEREDGVSVSDFADAINGQLGSLSAPGCIIELPDLVGKEILNKLQGKVSSQEKKTFVMSSILQLITYGAPGTGKSHKVDGLANNSDVASCVRTTFHPDSDYATFVGSYKPVMNGEKIAYEFRPQAFMKAYVRAWQEMAQLDSEGNAKKVVLVIEEINRGNCAQIFGDLFQLLDRGNGGYSTYPIEADTDLATWLAKDDQLGSKLAALSKPDDIKREDDWNDILSGKKLALPPNLYIWATMNTSDQSLFPIDSAFKRRWDWEYVPIAKPDKSDNPDWKERKIEVGDSLFDWWDFLVAINGHIAKTTDSEDKQLGYFFVKAEDATGCISADTFANKVLFYLYGDVFKSYDLPKDNCFRVGEKVLFFRDFFYSEKTEIEQSDGTKVVKKPGDVKLDVLTDFLNGLKWDGKGVTCEQKSAAVTTTMAGGTSATQDVTTSGGAGMETIAEQ